MHIISCNFLYDPISLFLVSPKLHQRIAFKYNFKINIVSMRHMTVFDTSKPLIYHFCAPLKSILCFLYPITSYTTLSASFNFDQSSSTYCLKIKIDMVMHTTGFDTPTLLIYHLCKANLMHFTSYNFLYDPLSVFQFRPNFINVFKLDIASN